MNDQMISNAKFTPELGPVCWMKLLNATELLPSVPGVGEAVGLDVGVAVGVASSSFATVESGCW
jgi:hypothetical protein